MIQFCTVTLLYAVGSNLTDTQFLYIDLVILVPLSIFMGQTGAYKELTPHLPTGSLLSFPVLTSVLGSVVIQLIPQFFVFFWVKQQSFYKAIDFNPEDDHDNMKSYENSVLLIITSFQYLVTCISFSISKPFRKPLYTNPLFMLSIMLLFIFNGALTIFNTNDDNNPNWIQDLFDVRILYQNLIVNIFID